MSVLETEYQRLVNTLPKVEPGTDKYRNLLNDISTIVYLMRDVRDAAQDSAVMGELPKAEEPKVEEPKEEEPKNTESYTKEDVREILTDASKNGVKIQPIMQQFIPEGQPAKLSSIPAASYAALVEAVRNA